MAAKPPANVRSATSIGEFYAEIVAFRAGVALDGRIKAAFAAVPREAFVGEGPWPVPTPPQGYILTPSADLAFLYSDIVVGLVPERSINNGEPSYHARCLAAAGIAPGEIVIHVGAGTGYYSAIMAELTTAAGRVEAFEIDRQLAALAKANLQRWPWTHVGARSGLEGPFPQADVVYVNAGVSHPPPIWLDALGPGGRLLVPLTAGRRGAVMLFTARGEGSFDARFISPVRIIPCVGGQDPVMAERLAKAFEANPLAMPSVRSLRRGNEPDESCWLAGDGWWLSTAPAKP
jgi:protein-L-isoaspartate(D-aspartate) O-methyltransferase